VKIPDYISPIIAFRMWQWGAAGLTSLNDVRWVAEQPMKARCSRPQCGVYNPETLEWEDNAPTENCTCGIYAAKSYEDMVNMGVRPQVYGEVYLWGKICEHKLGYRAQCAYPKNLTISYVRLELGIKMPRLETLVSYGVDVFFLPYEGCERMLVWSREVGFNRLALERMAEKKQYKDQYKCLYGNKGCGDNAVYCEPCNSRYERFLWILNDDR
jgi:hypothetical protein